MLAGKSVLGQRLRLLHVRMMQADLGHLLMMIVRAVVEASRNFLKKRYMDS